MSLASESHFIGLVDINRLLSEAQSLSVSVPEAWRLGVGHTPDEQTLAAGFDEFARDLYSLDTTQLSDERYDELEGWTRVVESLIRTYMFIRFRDSDCQPFAGIRRRLADAIEGFERGLPLDPSKRPTTEELSAKFDAEFSRLGVV